MEVYDIKAISSICRKHNRLVSIDCTVLSPLFCDPFDLGVDLVAHSSTKYISGHSDVLLGFVLTNNEQIYQRLLSMRECMENRPPKFTCWFAL
mmetsp:Transcript_12281/g.8930  ORF Transcript_12281/g.8930 Transcript_12281/m.8930 type:complete len:93 (+) Transcript_12281:337-615(+)